MAGKDGGMDASMMSRLKELEQENARLTRMYADVSMQCASLKETLAKNGKAISAG
jgi:putative transposase